MPRNLRGLFLCKNKKGYIQISFSSIEFCMNFDKYKEIQAEIGVG